MRVHLKSISGRTFSVRMTAPVVRVPGWRVDILGADGNIEVSVYGATDSEATNRAKRLLSALYYGATIAGAVRP